MKIKVHLFRVWPDVMGSRPGESLLAWGKMRCQQQQDEISSGEEQRWILSHEKVKVEENIQSIFKT